MMTNLRLLRRPFLSYHSSLHHHIPKYRYYSNIADFKPTIYALSTKFARSAIGVVRISGSQSQYIYNQLTKSTSIPKSRIASVRKLYSPQENILLDEALTLFFNSPKTYTGEDILELHLHGGTAIIQSVLKSINLLHDPAKGINIRYAENGEFSRRAFINGRFDLTEIEGIREMIDAETESQRIAALSSLVGDTKKEFTKWREEIVKNIALLTTVIDFGEDHDITEVEQLFTTVEDNMNNLSKEINAFLLKVLRSEILMKGIKLILLGPPNAGKSSLLNILANKDAAIVSDIAGTTRDVIDVPLDINGYKVVVGDTAGIRAVSDADKIEIEGIKRAKLKSLGGDLVLIVLPVDKNLDVDYNELLDHISLLKNERKEIIVVLNKEDLLPNVNTSKNEIVQKYSKHLLLPVENFHIVSCTNGSGISDLTMALTNIFRTISLSDTSDPIVISARAQDILKNDVLYGIEQFQIWRHQDDIVLASESLAQSAEGIGKITGDAIGVEEVLGVVFSSFCIGK